MQDTGAGDVFPNLAAFIAERANVNGSRPLAHTCAPRRATLAEMAEDLLDIACELDRRAAAKRVQGRRARAWRIAEERKRNGQLDLFPEHRK
jgi:hypothetical protein